MKPDDATAQLEEWVRDVMEWIWQDEEKQTTKETT